MIEVKIYEINSETKIVGVDDGFAVREYTGKVTITAAVTKWNEDGIVWYIPHAEYIFTDHQKGEGNSFEDDIRGLFKND